MKKSSKKLAVWSLSPGDVFRMGGNKYKITYVLNEDGQEQDNTRIYFVPAGAVAFDSVCWMVIPLNSELKVTRKVIYKDGKWVTKAEWESIKARKRLFEKRPTVGLAFEGKHRKGSR